MTVVVSALGARMGGGLAHLALLLAWIDRLNRDRQFLVLVHEDAVPHLPAQMQAVDLRVVPPMAVTRRFMWDQVVLPRICRSVRAEALLSLLNFGPRHPPCPQVVLQRNALYFLEHERYWSVRQRLDNLVRRRIALAACRGSQVVITPSNEMKAGVARYLHRHDKIVTLPHGVDLEFLSPNQDHLADLPAGLPLAGFPRLAYVSHAAVHKGHDYLLTAFADVLRQMPTARLALTVGQHESENHGDALRAREIARASRELNGVTLVGSVDRRQVRALYQWADIVVFPSRAESFGFPMVEAMAMAKPVIASDLPCLRELGHGVAVYHAPGDPAALAAAVVSLAADSHNLFQRGVAGRTRAASYGMESYVSQLFQCVDRAKNRSASVATTR